MTFERVAVVGSREFSPIEVVRAYVQTLPPGTVLVSGGAPGVDLTAEQEAKRCGLKRKIYAAHWWNQGHFDRSAGFRRNRVIVANCDRLVAFWDGGSPGTKNTIELAREKGIPTMVGTWAPGVGLVWGTL